MGIFSKRHLAVWAGVPLAFSLTGVALAQAAPAVAADELGLTLSTTPSGPETDSVKLRVTPPAKSGSRAVFVAQQTDEDLAQVAFRASTLVDEDDQPVEGEVCVSQRRETACTPAAEATLPAGGEVELYVHVVGLTRTGTFTSTLFAKKDAAIQTLGTVTITRGNDSGVLTIGAIQVRRAEKAAPWSSTTVTLEVTATNGGTRPVAIAAVVRGLAVAGEEGAGFGAADHTVTFERADEPAGDELILPGDDATFALVIGGVEHTGAYTGTVKLSAEGVQSATQTFAFNVRESGRTAGVVILLSVVLSFAARHLAGAGRTRLLRQRWARLLLDEIDALRSTTPPGSLREREVLDALEARLEGLYDEIDLGTGTEIQPALDEVNQKLSLFPLLARARNLVETTQPESLRPTFRTQLDEAAEFLKERTAGAGLADALKTHKASLTGMPAAVREKVKEHFLQQVDSFKKQAEDAAGSGGIPAEVVREIEGAKTLAETDVVAAAAGLKRALKAFADTMAAELAASLPGERNVPAGFDGATWPKVREATESALVAVTEAKSAEEAVRRYREVAQAYVLKLAARLRDAAEEREADEADAGRKAKLAQAAQDAQAAVVHATGGAFRTARDSYAKATSAYREGMPPKPGMLGGIGAGAAAVALADATDVRALDTLEVLASEGDAGAIADRTSRTYRSARTLKDAVKSYEAGLTVLVVLVAVVTGLQLLWDGNATWGRFADYAAAFLWGLGLHQVADKAFDPASVRSMIGGAAPAAGSGAEK